ncbi:cysteine hydrolase [Herbaspirillum huttiense F1]|uniref:cysteine hydrolase n=1 Tax=Herbaspirillum TaxID=963 RepID=UPI00195D38C3|nr:MULTISPECIES: cysteine hydrolase [Herbaspirillum]MBP1317253.1 nicotinamidase-related amidase [Herbaspirillum sp. 1130]MDR6741520.1 nicotinamidase-related amidase [Herbaspirillum sp. 1173]MDT0357074.1 cysteine hydrolase [Herbaspirillum huttiense F1]
MKRSLHLLVIDPQNDFCDLPTDWLPVDPVTGGVLQPALPVAGSHADLQRVARLIDQGGTGLSAISITLDAHHRLDIAHPTFWQQADGAAVTPFTQIEAAQVRAGAYLPRDPQALPRALAYLDALETAGRYRLMVWPVHCEIGSWGGAVHADVRAAYNRWEERTLGVVTKLGKGSNPWTEHYSAVMAEVPDDDDPATQLNRGFIATLAQADTVYITGEAGSHCVRATTEHIAANLDAAGRARLVLVTDCMSPVAGFEAQYQDFLAAMSQAGVRLATSEQVLQELQANA